MSCKETLIDKLTNLYFSKEIENWNSTKPDYDLSNIMASFEVHVHPYGAKTIDEVEYFDIVEDVMGSITTTFSRKKIK